MKIPFSTAVYEHAARFVNRSPWAVSRDPKLMFEAHRAAWLTYRHTPIVVGIDIYNLETEAYGARIPEPAGNGIPAIHEPLFDTLDEALNLAPFDPQHDGRIASVIAVGQQLKKELPEAEVRIPVSGPFSIAFNLRGINNLCEDAALRPDDVAAWLMRLANNQAVFCRAIAQAGLDVAFFESAASPPMLSPRQFRELELPALKRIMAIAGESVGHAVPCIMGGNTFLILDDLLATGTSYLVCNPETDQAAFVANVGHTHPHVKVRVNMISSTVVSTDPAILRGEIDRILKLTAGYSNCILGTGALPYETPIENIRLIKDYVS